MQERHEQRIPGPTVRSRINFSRLVKTGWQFEATVEMTFEAIVAHVDSTLALQLVGEEGSVLGSTLWTTEMAALIAQTNQLGQEEVDRLNAADAVEAKAA